MIKLPVCGMVPVPAAGAQAQRGALLGKRCSKGAKPPARGRVPDDPSWCFPRFRPISEVRPSSVISIIILALSLSN